MILNAKGISFENPKWKKVPFGPIDLLKKLLHFGLKMRPNADKALEHDWIKQLGEFTVGHDEIRKSLDCFKNFRNIGAM